MSQELSHRQARILEYIRDVTRIRNYPPSVREIGEAVGRYAEEVRSRSFPTDEQTYRPKA